MRFPLLAGLIVLSLGTSRVAHAEHDLDAGPLHVDFKVEAPDRKAPLASGSMEMETDEMTEFESTPPAGDPTRLKMKLYSRIHHDGTVAVWVEFNEVGAKGDALKWQPALQGKRGAPMTASVSIGSTSRTITVTVR